MKKFYYIVEIKENKKYYAYVAIIKENENLIHSRHFTQENIYSITPCSTRKQARAIVEAWNAIYKNGGVYLFDDGPQF